MCCLGVLSSLDQPSARFIISDFLFIFRSLMKTFMLQHAELRTGTHVLLYSIINSKRGFLCVLGFQFLCCSIFICKIRIILLSNSQRNCTSKVPWLGTKTNPKPKQTPNYWKERRGEEKAGGSEIKIILQQKVLCRPILNRG